LQEDSELGYIIPEPVRQELLLNPSDWRRLMGFDLGVDTSVGLTGQLEIESEYEEEEV
jgi:hypothetical protein